MCYHDCVALESKLFFDFQGFVFSVRRKPTERLMTGLTHYCSLNICRDSRIVRLACLNVEWVQVSSAAFAKQTVGPSYAPLSLTPLRRPSTFLRRFSLYLLFCFSLQCDEYTMPSKRLNVVAGEDDGGDDKIYLNDTEDVGPIHIMSADGTVRTEDRRGIRMRF